MPAMVNVPAVVPNSPADKAKIKQGDIILECDGEKATMDKPLQEFLNDKSAGDTIKLKAYRNKKIFEVKVKLAEKK